MKSLTASNQRSNLNPPDWPTFFRERMRHYLEFVASRSIRDRLSERMREALFGDDARVDEPGEQYSDELIDLLFVIKGELESMRAINGEVQLDDDDPVNVLEAAYREAVRAQSPVTARRGLLAYLRAEYEQIAREEYEAALKE